MDNNYLVQRRINAKKQFRRKVALTAILGSILLILIVIGLIKVILDEKNGGGEIKEKHGQTSEQLTTGEDKKGNSGDGNSDGNSGMASEADLTPTATLTPTSTPTPTPEPGPKVIVDPGHGGEDLGSVRQGLYEKDANLAIALYLRTFLEEAGYEVYMLRETDADVPNESRPQTAIEQEGDLYVSIHLNSLDADSDATQGAETWYSNLRDDNSDVLAQNVIDELTKVIDTRNRGIKLSNKLIVLKYNGMPACLVECGFITSETERAKLFNPEYQEKIARGIANGIMKFMPVE